MIIFACNFKAGLQVRHKHKHKDVCTCDKNTITYAGAQAYKLTRTWRAMFIPEDLAAGSSDEEKKTARKQRETKEFG